MRSLKIKMASNATSRQEVDVLKKANYRSVISPETVDSFDLIGPNGLHTELALELFDSSLEQFTSKCCSGFNPTKNTAI